MAIPAAVDLQGFAQADAIDRGFHIIEDAALGNAAQQPERLGERHEGSATTGLQLTLPIRLPAPDKRRNPTIRAIIAQGGQLSVKLLRNPLLLA